MKGFFRYGFLIFTLFLFGLSFSGDFVSAADDGDDIFSSIYGILGAPINGVVNFVNTQTGTDEQEFFARFIIWLILFALFFMILKTVFSRIGMEQSKKGPVISIALALAVFGSVGMPASLIRFIFQSYGLFAFLLFFGAILGVMGYLYMHLKDADGKTHPAVAFTFNLIFFLFLSALKKNLLVGGPSAWSWLTQETGLFSTFLDLIYLALSISLFVTGFRLIGGMFRSGKTPEENKETVDNLKNKGKDFITKQLDKREKAKKTKQKDKQFEAILSKFLMRFKKSYNGDKGFVDYLYSINTDQANSKVLSEIERVLRALLMFEQDLGDMGNLRRFTELKDLAVKYKVEIQKISERLNSQAGLAPQNAIENFNDLKNYERKLLYSIERLAKEESEEK